VNVISSGSLGPGGAPEKLADWVIGRKCAVFPPARGLKRESSRGGCDISAKDYKKIEDSVAMCQNVLYNLQSFRSCKVTLFSRRASAL
jgi:hypothetical protein